MNDTTKVVLWVCHICKIKFDIPQGGICSRCKEVTCSLHLKHLVFSDDLTDKRIPQLICANCLEEGDKVEDVEHLKTTVFDLKKKVGGHFVWRVLTGSILFAAFYSFLLLLYLFPHRPNSLVGWLILLGIGVPLSIVMEWLAEIAFSEKIAKKISKKRLSGARILYALGFILSFIAVMYVLWKVLGPYIHGYFT